MSHIHPHAHYPYCHGQYYGHPYYQWLYFTPAYNPMVCSTCCQPLHMCQCQKPLSPMKIPQELLAESSTQQAFIGGSEAVSLSLEYLKTGPSPNIDVKITENGQTSTWNITTIPDEYQVKENFITVSPGAVVDLSTTDCTARLRWCEVICC